MVKFYILPSKLQREAIMLQEVALTTGYVQKMVANAADGLSSIGIGEVGPNIWAIEQALAKQKSMLDLLGESLGDIIRRVNSAEDTVLGSLPSDFAVPTEHPNNPMMYNVNNGWRVGGGVGPGNGFSAPTFMGRSLPVVLRDANGAGNSDDPFSEFLPGNDDKRPEFDYEKSDINNGYYALKNPVPMAQFDYDAMGSGMHEVIKNGQVVGYQVDKNAMMDDFWRNTSDIWQKDYAPNTDNGGFDGGYTVSQHADKYDIEGGYHRDDSFLQINVGDIDAHVGNGALLEFTTVDVGVSLDDWTVGVDVGTVNVGAGIDINVLDQDGNLDVHVDVGGGAEVSAGDAYVSNTSYLFGVEITTQASTGIGAGQYAHVGYSDGVLNYTFDLAVLGKVGLSGQIDFNDASFSGRTDITGILGIASVPEIPTIQLEPVHTENPKNPIKPR